MGDDRDHLSLRAHVDLPLIGPLDLAALDSLLDEADLEAGRRVLDLGCGRGDVGLRCARLFGTLSTLVDRSPVLVAEATLRSRGAPGVDVVCADAREYLEGEVENVALAISLGASHALGGLASAVRAMEPTLAAGGAILVGDLVALGPIAATTFEIPHLDEVRLAMTVARRVVVSPETMDAYERAWTAAVERHLHHHPDDPAAAWARERIAWMAGARDARRELAFAAWLLR